MAITWELEITFLDKERKRVSAKAIATDSENPSNPITVNILDARIESDDYKKALWDNIKDHYDKKVQEQGAINAAVASLEEAGKTYLEKL